MSTCMSYAMLMMTAFVLFTSCQDSKNPVEADQSHSGQFTIDTLNVFASPNEGMFHIVYHLDHAAGYVETSVIGMGDIAFIPVKGRISPQLIQPGEHRSFTFQIPFSTPLSIGDSVVAYYSFQGAFLDGIDTSATFHVAESLWVRVD